MSELSEKWADCIAVINKGAEIAKQTADSLVKVNIKHEENENPVVSGANVMCDQMVKGSGPLVQVVHSTPSYDERNGNVGLKDTDIKLIPMGFGLCKVNNQPCHLKILGEKWIKCNSMNPIAGRPSVRMNSFMVCLTEKGKITLINDGQRIGGKLSEKQIEELLEYMFNKVGWTEQEDCAFIAKVMKLAGMDTQMSIEFFILTACSETGKGAALRQYDGTGRGFMQLTGTSSADLQTLATIANGWKKACGKSEVKWKTNPPSNYEILEAAAERNDFAWEASIYYWCNMKPVDRDPPLSLNEYVEGYEDESLGTYNKAGLYYATQCFVNGAATGTPAGDMRDGKINEYIIQKKPDGKDYEYEIVGNGKSYTAPTGAITRVKEYMDYYGEESYVWNIKEDLPEQENE